MSFLIPSPLDQINYSSKQGIDYSLSIKRDDQIHPLISGNKWRKLILHIQQFSKSQRNGIVTFGGPWSNHLLATACACQIYEISCIGFVRGDYHRFVNPFLTTCSELGMDLRYVSNAAFDQATADPDHFISVKELSNYQVIPMGGDDEKGIAGSQQIVQEVVAHDQRPDTWLIPAGTGATAAGILQALDYECQVRIFPAINQVAELEKLESKLSVINSAATWSIEKPHRCRFGAVDQSLVDFLRSFHAQTGILLDPLYNGKMMETYFSEYGPNPHNQVLAYHSGGLVGWKGIVPKWNNRTDLSFLGDVLGIVI